MTVTLVTARDSAALTDGWRVPREQVRPMREALALLRESDRRLTRATAEIEARRAAAEQSGYDQGRADGERRAAAEVAQALAALTERAERERAELRARVGELALEVVRRVAGDLDPAAFVPAMMERAVRDVLPDQPMRVRVARAVAPAVEARLWAINAAIEVVPDDQLGPLDGVLETANGRVQAGLEDQLSALARAFAPAGRAP